MSNRFYYMLAVGILLIAAGLRLWDLTSLPLGLSDAEITHVRLTETIRRGDITVFYQVNGRGQEGFYHTALALLTSAAGRGVLGYRIFSTLAGMVTLALTYALGTRLFGYIAGLAATALLASMMWASLLARLVHPQTLVPLLVTATMLALAHALPVYRSRRHSGTNTIAFAVLGGLLGLGFYIHPFSLMITLASMCFIAYIMLVQRPLSRRRLSYIGFAILMMVIIAVPYLISSINLPELAAAGRIFGDYRSVLASIGESFSGVLFAGDSSPITNLPKRPMIDLVSGFFVLVGLLAMIRQGHLPRYALVLCFAIVLLPAAVLADETPNFLSMSALLPPLALLFGLGVQTLIESQRRARIRHALLGAVLLLFVFQTGWTVRDLFIHWRGLEEVQTAYHSDAGAVALRLDRTTDDMPAIICYPDWDNREPRSEFSQAQLVLLMMNRAEPNLRYVDCRQGLLFTDGGARQQIVLPEPGLREAMHPFLRRWLDHGQAVEAPLLPEGAVITLDIQAELADALGVYQTTTPARYGFEAANRGDPSAPPIRFGGNLTWLGYERDAEQVYQPGEHVPVINIWRVDGMVPSDLLLFTHILTDPSTIVSQRDVISVDPRRLRARDIFIQVTEVPLDAEMRPGEYLVSVGAYQGSDQTRMVVLQDGEAQGDRLFLYSITVTQPEEAAE